MPTALVISKAKTHILKGTDNSNINKGAYIVRKEAKKLDGILVTSGSELTNTLLIAEKLKNELDLRVISMPCQELFLEQSDDYKNSILPKDNKIICIEASTKDNWTQFTKYDYVIGLDSFGTSGKASDVIKKYHLDEVSLMNKVKELLK